MHVNGTRRDERERGDDAGGLLALKLDLGRAPREVMGAAPPFVCLELHRQVEHNRETDTHCCCVTYRGLCVSEWAEEKVLRWRISAPISRSK